MKTARAAFWLISAPLIAWAVTAPWLGGTIVRTLDRSYARMPLASCPAADAIAVLSGDGAPRDVKSPDEPLSRSEAALALYQMGKGRWLVVTSGGTEGPASRMEFIRRGVDPGRILTAEPAYNTADEVREIADLAEAHGWHSLILVTSGYHMARSEAMLEYYSVREHWPLRVVAFAADSGKLFGDLYNYRKYIPSHAGLDLSLRAVKESLGAEAARLQLRFAR